VFRSGELAGRRVLTALNGLLLRVARAEIRHSNFLAWLLDPGESHGHGDLFLKALALDLLRKCPVHLRPLSPLQLDGIDLSDVTVRREWPGKLDLCIACGSPPFVLAFENKVDSGEHSGQLGRYADALAAAFPDRPCLKVFLTRSADAASDPLWIPYSYSDVHRVFSRLRRMPGGSLGGDVGVFLDHYLNLIGSQFMDNPEIVDLCRRIYVNHRRAIDLINTHAQVAGSEAMAPILEWLQNRSTAWTVRRQNARRVSFVPAAWVGATHSMDGKPFASAACDLYIEVEAWGNEHTRVSVRLVVGTGDHQAKRRRVIELLTSEYGLSMAREEPTEQWTRLGSLTLARWPADAEVPAEKLVAEFEKWLNSHQAILAHIPKLLAMVSREPIATITPPIEQQSSRSRLRRKKRAGRGADARG
jgi:hypothetical protein